MSRERNGLEGRKLLLQLQQEIGRLQQENGVLKTELTSIKLAEVEAALAALPEEKEDEAGSSQD